jgi:hypothetical protein
MLKSQTCTIDGSEYTVQQLPAMKAQRLFVKIAGILSPAVSRLANGRKITSIADLNLSVVGDALGVLGDRLTPDEYENIVRQLLYSVTRKDLDGKLQDISKSFDIEFAGEMVTVLKLVRFAFEVNYGDFFSVGRLLAKFAPTLAEPSPSKE